MSFPLWALTGTDPGERRASTEIAYPQFSKMAQKDSMINGIECYWEVKKNQDGCTASIPLPPEVIHEHVQCCLSPKPWSEPQVKRGQIIILIQGSLKLSCDRMPWNGNRFMIFLSQLLDCFLLPLLFREVAWMIYLPSAFSCLRLIWRISWF